MGESICIYLPASRPCGWADRERKHELAFMGASGSFAKHSSGDEAPSASGEVPILGCSLVPDAKLGSKYAGGGGT